MSSHHGRKARNGGQAAFTLIELMVALAVTMVVMLGVLAMFDLSNKLSRVQTHITDMQQSLRMAQYDMVRMARMAGRGGLSAALPGQALPLGTGISIRSNVPDGEHLLAADTSSPEVLAGSDVLTLRGAFATPVYQVDYTKATFSVTGPGAPAPNDATGGSLLVCKKLEAGLEQDLSALEGLIQQAAADATKARKEALLLVSPASDTIYAVVQLDPAGSSILASSPLCLPGSAAVSVRFNSDRTDSLVTRYRTLYPAPVAGNLPGGLTKVAYFSLLEEHRFYIRKDHAIEGDATSELTPVLSRARVYPGTDLPYGGDAANLRQDVADGILDLQLALGFDVNGDEQLVEDAAAPESDEWLGNAAGEDPITGSLKALRISTLARTRRPDNKFAAPDLERLEDHEYDLEEAADPVNGETARKYRRRTLQTIANLRNLTT